MSYVFFGSSARMDTLDIFGPAGEGPISVSIISNDKIRLTFNPFGADETLTTIEVTLYPPPVEGPYIGNARSIDVYDSNGNPAGRFAIESNLPANIPVSWDHLSETTPFPTLLRFYNPDVAEDLLVGQDSLNGFASNHRAAGDLIIRGYDGSDQLEGGVGSDKLYGGEGNDSFVDYKGGADIYYGEAGDDNFTIYGRAKGTYYGGEGSDDFIFENVSTGVESQLVNGGSGDDWYFVNRLRGTLTIQEADGEGFDIVRTSASFRLTAGAEIERLTTDNNPYSSTSPVELVGNRLAQEIVGNLGDNVLNDGGEGEADILRGRDGNDTYRVFNSGDTIIEGAAEGAADKVMTSVDYVLGVGVYVETLQTNGSTGTEPVNLTGNALAQEIIGNAGDNVLRDGGPGASDLLRGLSGNDTYGIFNAGDTIVESSAQGLADKVVAAVSYKLGAGVHIETLQTNGSTGTLAIQLTGNETAQTIIGNYGDNRLDGKDGADTLRGLAGDDTFVFSSKLGATNVDAVVDFKPADDRFLLSDNIFTALDPGSLKSGQYRANNTGLAQDASDKIVYDMDDGKLFYDADGIGGADGVLFATVGLNLAITAADFDAA